MAPTTKPEPPVDGRTARSIRTRAAIVEACVELLEDGDLRPTAPRIAEQAGVSVRSIFQHFGDLETLFGAVGARVAARLALLVTPIDPTGPLEERIAAFVCQRSEINEEVRPMLIAASIHAPTLDTVNVHFETGYEFYRQQVREVFAPEIAAAGDDGEALADLVHVASMWSTWDALRSYERRTPEACSAMLEATLRLLLAR